MCAANQHSLGVPVSSATTDHSADARLRSNVTAAPTSRTVLFAAATVFLDAAHAQIDDSVRGEPNEANHFIETPRGWEHPRTPWGEPDIQATLDMMQASRIPLERCADSYSGRRLPTFLFGDVAGSGGGARARACDMQKA